MIITDEEKSKEIMQGYMTFSPMVDIEVQKRLFSELKDVADITATNPGWDGIRCRRHCSSIICANAV